MPHRFLPNTATACCSARAHSVTRQRVPNADVRPSSQSARTKKNRNPTVWSCRSPARPTTSAGIKPFIFQFIFLCLILFNQQMTGCKFTGRKVQNESRKHIPATQKLSFLPHGGKSHNSSGNEFPASTPQVPDTDEKFSKKHLTRSSALCVCVTQPRSLQPAAVVRFSRIKWRRQAS